MDVEDLFEYAAVSPRPSGIQRVAFETCRALHEAHGDSGRIRFVRHDQLRNSLTPVPWAAVAALFDQLAGTDGAGRGASRPRLGSEAAEGDGSGGGLPAESRQRWLARRLIRRLPPEFRQRLLLALRLQFGAVKAGAELLLFLARAAGDSAISLFRRRPVAAAGTAGSPLQGSFASSVRPGDCLVSLGAPWPYPDYAGLVRDMQRRFGLRFAFLVFDIIPARRPEWSDRGLVRIFGAWIASVLPVADVILTISRATAADVERFATENRIALRSAIQVVPMGTGFASQLRPEASQSEAPQSKASGSARLPPAGSYALFVSTIEARKNHALLFRVWRRMLDDMPAAEVPTLVFAGRIGWLVEDLMKQLDNTDFLNRKIRIIQDVTDAELADLYRGCLFTLFPSLYEGWGLPVTESLALGKPCIAARNTSIPEAGGSLAHYFDPDCVSDAYAVIRATIEDREGLAAWQEEIARSFVPVPWAATADAVLHAIDAIPEPAGPARPIAATPARPG